MEPGSGRQAADLRDDDGRALHARLLRRETTAPSDLALQYLPPLVAWLRGTFPRLDEAMLETIADDVILDLAEHPERYDPARGSLPAYLRMAVRGDLKNALQSERRRTARQISLDDVELRAPARNRVWAGASDPGERVVDADADGRFSAMLEQFVGRDREVVEWIVDGERRTEVFAGALGLHDRPQEEQVREVKRTKDRLKKRMQRIWRGMERDG